MRRKNNQDARNSLVSSDEGFWRNRGHLFVVADGMGAHAAGELASKLAADSIPHTYSKDLETDPITAIYQAITEANTTIHERGQSDPEFHGMGTTCSSLLLLPEGAVAAHVGDSRIYRLREGQLEQLTFDHSLVWEMQATGRISAEAAEMHLPKNVITRSLGPNPHVQIDLEGPFSIFKDDVYLLCSDGLTGQVSDQEIGVILGCLPPEEATQILVDLANLRGGPDNITVIAAQVDHPPIAQNESDVVEPNTVWIPFVIWLTTLLFLIVAIVLLVFGQPILAIVPGIGAIVASIVGLLKKFEPPQATIAIPQPVKLLGRGPYRSYDCTPTGDTTEKFSGISEELRKTTEQLGNEVDWQRYDVFIEKARDAAHREDFTESIYQYCRGISFIVAALKNSDQMLRTSDSHVDLI